MPGRQTAGVLAAAFLLSAFLYWPALHGELISDDLATLAAPEIQSLDWASLRAIFDPHGPLVPVLVNYAPLHALFHALEIACFDHDLFALHLVNVALHALIAVQLALLFVRSGIRREAAWLGALLFLVHPANVEAVAWISQLKTTSSTALALGALLAHRRRPALAAALFGCALLAKAQAAFALPVLACCEALGTRGVARSEARDRWLWVGAWALGFAVFSAIEAPVLVGFGTTERADFAADRWLHVRTVVAIAARYLWLAATGLGASALHEPPLAVSITDPWWLAGLVALGAIGARAAYVALRRRNEAAYWLWAAVAYAPVSQVLPFQYLMSDRYLYTVLPGLLGAGMLAGSDLATRLRDPARQRALQRVAAVAAVLLALVFAVQVRRERAPIWQNPTRYEIDAALHYPDGVSAWMLRARGSARRGDVEGAVTALRAARARGWTWIGALFADPAFEGVQANPLFRDFAREVTAQSIAALRALPNPAPHQLEILAQLHLWRGERAEALAALERIVASGDPVAAPAARRTLTELRGAPR